MRPIVPLVLVLLLAGCASSELPGVKNVRTVVPGTLVRGGQPDEEGFAALQRAYGIRTVINLNDRTEASEAEHVNRLGMAYVALPTEAHDIQSEVLLAFLRILSDPTVATPIYVHCAQGMDRTGAAIAAYRIVMDRWTAEQALAELERYQALSHTLVFRNIPPLVERVERERPVWREALTPPSERRQAEMR